MLVSCISSLHLLSFSVCLVLSDYDRFFHLIVSLFERFLPYQVAETRRANMRNALARRMKMDLIEGEEAKISQLQEDQFSELDQRLKQVEQLREDNRKREYMLNKQVERQQAQIARNVRISAAELQNND